MATLIRCLSVYYKSKIFYNLELVISKQWHAFVILDFYVIVLPCILLKWIHRRCVIWFCCLVEDWGQNYRVVPSLVSSEDRMMCLCEVQNGLCYFSGQREIILFFICPYCSRGFTFQKTIFWPNICELSLFHFFFTKHCKYECFCLSCEPCIMLTPVSSPFVFWCLYIIVQTW